MPRCYSTQYGDKPEGFLNRDFGAQASPSQSQISDLSITRWVAD